MIVLTIVAFVLAFVEQVRAKGSSLLAWAIIALTVLQAIDFVKSL